MYCFGDFISLNNVTVLKMLEENWMHLRCLTFAGVWISHKIKNRLVKYTDKYVRVYLVLLFLDCYFLNIG